MHNEKIIKKAKCLAENEQFLVLKTGSHAYCVYSKKEDRVVFETTCASDCYKYYETRTES